MADRKDNSVIHNYLDSRQSFGMSEDVKIKLSVPRKQFKNAVPLAKLFNHLNEYDSDFPIVDFDNTDGTWKVDSKIHSDGSFEYRLPNISVSSFINILKLAGWEIDVLHWSAI